MQQLSPFSSCISTVHANIAAITQEGNYKKLKRIALDTLDLLATFDSYRLFPRLKTDLLVMTAIANFELGDYITASNTCYTLITRNPDQNYTLYMSHAINALCHAKLGDIPMALYHTKLAKKISIIKIP